jgi:hypothetical protein
MCLLSVVALLTLEQIRYMVGHLKTTMKSNRTKWRKLLKVVKDPLHQRRACWGTSHCLRLGNGELPPEHRSARNGCNPGSPVVQANAPRSYLLNLARSHRLEPGAKMDDEYYFVR